MKPLEIVLAFAVLGVLLGLSFGGGAYWQSKRTPLPDTVRVVTYVPQAPTHGTAVHVAKPKRDTMQAYLLRKARSLAPAPDELPATLPGDYSSDSVTIPRAEYDSLTTPQYYTIDSDAIGHMALTYDPLTRILTYDHEPPPLKLETVEVTREMPVSFWKKLEYGVYGAAVGIVATLLIAH